MRKCVAGEKDVDKAKPGVAEINVSESGKLVGLLEDLSRRLNKLETATAKATQKKTYGRSQANENRAAKTQFVPNVQAKTFVPNNQAVTRQDVSNNNKKDSRLNAPPPQTQQNNVGQRSTQPMQLFVFITKHSVTEHARTENLARFLASGEIAEARHGSAVAPFPSLSPSKLLYVADKHNKCNYLIDTGAACYPSHALTGFQTLPAFP